ncbi:winged helix-turn-helix domain-containing protein [Rhodococcus globerulus]|uniref:Winged helix-turn-helix domain-containing protein n=1 Tax=Rhodococcus globerulus TaxID=33008 RepID=A0ABU4C4X5_RHOGO|nr:winged helix-turn-helix domain-containing protein [Rhodococcus globerulus]MDV6271470.1 winged helix-turn-helix domain-containing protein [Rhodococcus globerulus]
MPAPPHPGVLVIPTIEDIAERCRAQLDRLTPEQALAELRDGALLVDIRQEHFRRSAGHIPGSLVLERNVLEWRLDPRSDFRIPLATDHDLRVILICPHGSVSSIAAVSLQSIGLHRATDVVGGFVEWRAANLPMVPQFTPTGLFVESGAPRFVVDQARQQVVIDDRIVSLTRLEYIVLTELISASGRVATKNELKVAVGDWEGSRSRSIDSLIHRLRHKLGDSAGSTIVTERGVGFRLRTGPSSS